MHKIVEDKIKFEKDLLDILKKYDFCVEAVTRIQIDIKVDCLPEIKLTYFKQKYTLLHKIKSMLTVRMMRLKYSCNPVR